MAMFTGLARVARKTGYPVIEQPGWKTRGHGHMGTVKSVIVHHTAGGLKGNAPSLMVVQAGRSDLPGPLSHYVLGRDGTIYVVAAGLCAHAGKDSQLKAAHRNVHSIGIEAENTGVGEPWGAAQLDAYVKLCAALVDEFALSPGDVLGHKEIAPGRKIDPAGIDMGDFRKQVAKQVAGKTITPVSAIKPIPKDEQVVSKPAPQPAKEDTLSAAEVQEIKAYILETKQQITAHTSKAADNLRRDLPALIAKAVWLDTQYPSRAPGADPKKTHSMAAHTLATNGKVYELIEAAKTNAKEA